MKLSTLFVFAAAAAASFVGAAALPASIPSAQVLQLAAESDRDVIVIMRDQVPSLPAVRGNRPARADTLAASQASLIAGLQQTRPRTVRSFKLINAFAVKVSSAEAAQLAAHPLVRAVVPDRVIRIAKRPQRRAAAAGVGAASIRPEYSTTTPSGPLCNTLEPEALQLMNAAFLDPTVPQAQEVLDGNGKPVTGRGVKVAIIADGLDIHDPGFTRPDGSNVFFDYQNLTGDPPGTPTDGGEAFGDASSIAAQDTPNGKPLLYDISQYTSPSPLPTPCNIRIRGVAPGASLALFDVFSNLDYTNTSAFVQAIEYAVFVDDVDIINESFGYNPLPDTSLDPVSLANDTAVQAGVTVVSSAGDSGTAGTLGSPATDPYVISAGASTQFRAYSQTYEGVAILTNGGWVSNNVSSLSSGGFAQTAPSTVDVLAPGDLGWALCSANVTVYTDCYNFEGNPTPIELFGGTSEASPLTAATAALVIQAYRSTHGGNTPSPALVKRLIMSTATDLGAPAFEQGAGLVNALAAVQGALSMQNSYHPKPAGSGLLYGPNAVTVQDEPHAAESTSFTVTNNGASTQHLLLALQTLGPPIAGATLNLNLNAAHDPSFLPGDIAPYITKTFIVPAGAEHLDAAFAVPVTATTVPLVFMSLIDPSGRQAAYSLPQGVGNGYGHVDVVKPLPGKWTVNLSTYGPASPVSYSGPLQFTWAAENYVNFGSVSPSKVELAPGGSVTVKAGFDMPGEPGDLAAAVRFTSTTDGGATYADLPVSLRTLIPTGGTGGTFSGTLTGGNGRLFGSPTQTFAFNVPSGIANMSLVLDTSDNGYALQGILVDPNGMPLSVQANVDPLGAPQYALSMFRYNPQPGLWHFLLLQNYYSSGNQTSLPYNARIGFNTAQVSAPTLPDTASVHLSARGAPVEIPITVTNTGASTAAYFADARLGTPAPVSLAASSQSPVAAGLGDCTSPAGSQYTTLPGVCFQVNVPTETTDIQFFAHSPVALGMDVAYDAGYDLYGTGSGTVSSPDLFAHRLNATTVLASTSEPAVPWGPWLATPAEVAPYGASGAPTEPVSVVTIAETLPFDSAAAADSGDIWEDQVLGTATYNPLLIAPGEAGVITLTITPDPKKVGQVVEGYVFVDTYSPATLTGDEVVRIPYKYTVVK